MNDLQKELSQLRDIAYADFQARLMPSVERERIIGIRTPVLRKFAAEYSKNPKSRQFLSELPHVYYEENNLHAFLVERINDFDEAVRETERFLPFIDNWATCDSFSPKVFGKYPERILPYAEKWLRSDKTYTIRYAIGVYMSYFLGEGFDKSHMDRQTELEHALPDDGCFVNLLVCRI